VLAPATLAALPSTRATPDRDVFYVAHLIRSVQLFAADTPKAFASRQPPLQLLRGNHEPFNRLALNQSIHNFRDVGDRDAPVQKVIGFD
jgi:hypothetical protein